MTATESAESVAAEMGPWRIARENGLSPRYSIAELAFEWAAELEPHDAEARQEAEDGALAGFDRYLAGVKA